MDGGNTLRHFSTLRKIATTECTAQEKAVSRAAELAARGVRFFALLEVCSGLFRFLYNASRSKMTTFAQNFLFFKHLLWFTHSLQKFSLFDLTQSDFLYSPPVVCMGCWESSACGSLPPSRPVRAVRSRADKRLFMCLVLRCQIYKSPIKAHHPSISVLVVHHDSVGLPRDKP